MSTNSGIKCRTCGCEIEDGQGFMRFSSGEYVHTVFEDCVAAARKDLLAALRGLMLMKDPPCWCPVAIGNPMMHGEHSEACLAARAAVARAEVTK